jgi:hypothetical protein
MPFHKPRNHSPLESLSPGDLEVLEDICSELNLRLSDIGDDAGRIIDFALRRMYADLNSGANREVIEDVQREVLFRQWCVEKMGAGAVASESPDALSSLPPL